jgi:hypothetical protein
MKMVSTTGATRGTAFICAAHLNAHLTIETTWSPDGIYRNATAEFEGYAGIARAVTAAHDAFVATGFVFTLANVDTNHDAVRYRWEMLPASGGEPDSIGTHVAVVGTDGRLVSDHQFIDKAPSAR